MKKILIYDDVPGFRDKLRKLLESLTIVTDTFEVDTLDEEGFEVSMETLRERRCAFRETGTWDDERIPLDDVSIFVVDYDLFEASPFLTAEALAYLARCFSSCGLIVGVNQYGHNTFDLTLRGHPESFADLNVGEKQLDNPNLWGQWVSGFHPWCWPALSDYLDDFEKKIEDVRGSLENGARIHEVLGFSSEVFDMLPRSIGQFLGREPAETTFRQFVVESNDGLKLKDTIGTDDVSEDVLARIGAARISKWLERLVLPGQDILVDAPHLVSRYPSLLTGNVEDIEVWNGTALLTSHDELGMSTDLIEPFQLKKDHWLSRPVWFWDDLRECEDIREVREPWKFERPDWVFCEDTSRFHARNDCREFVADVESPYARRFVRGGGDDVDYRPRVRFSL